MLSLETLKDKQQFLQHENSFMIHVCKNIVSEIILKKNKFKSLEDSEEHSSAVCKLPFTVSHLQKRAHPLLWFELILQLSSQHDAGSYLGGTFLA